MWKEWLLRHPATFLFTRTLLWVKHLCGFSIFTFFLIMWSCCSKKALVLTISRHYGSLYCMLLSAHSLSVPTACYLTSNDLEWESQKYLKWLKEWLKCWSEVMTPNRNAKHDNMFTFIMLKKRHNIILFLFDGNNDLCWKVVLEKCFNQAQVSDFKYMLQVVLCHICLNSICKLQQLKTATGVLKQINHFPLKCGIIKIAQNKKTQYLKLK